MAKDAGNRFSDAYDVRLKNGRLTIKNSLVDVTDQLDFYEIKLSGRSNFSCLLDKLDGDANLTLFDRKGKELAASEESGEDAESLSLQLNSGSYFVRVNRIQGDTDYQLKFSVTQDAGNNFKQSFKIRPGKDKLKGKFNFNDALGNGDDSDYYQFDLTSRSNCSTLLSGLKANANITIFDSRKQQIAFSSKGGNRNEKIDAILDAGTYFIKIDLKSKLNIKSVSTNYKLKLSFTSLTIDLGDNGTTTARPIIISPNINPFDDFVGTADPEDFYKVDLTSPSNLNLVLSGLSADANLELQNSSGTVIGSSTNTGTAQDLLDLNLAAGTYFVRVFPAAGATSTSYKLDFDLSPLRLFGLADNNNLVAFDSTKLDKAVNIAVTGLASGETLRGIDFRPATGKLFGLSSTNKLYTIDLATGAATTVGTTPITPALTGTSLGFDFNPTVDRIRVVSDADENLRLNPDTGAVVDFDAITTGTQFDTALAYATGDQKFGSNPNVTAAAYTNNVAGSTTTTLFGIDTTLDVLVRQGGVDGASPSPNAGSLSTIGALGVDFAPNAAFDIFSDTSSSNTAYAISGSTLYSINLTTGAATSLGVIKTASTSTGTGTGTTPPPPLNLIGLAARP